MNYVVVSIFLKFSLLSFGKMIQFDGSHIFQIRWVEKPPTSESEAPSISPSLCYVSIQLGGLREK